MLGRILVALLALTMGLGLTAASVAAGGSTERAVLRDDDGFAVEVAYQDDDDGQGGSNSGNSGNSGDTGTSGVDSNDGTNSKVTPVSKDKDRSWDDLTKDLKDGPGSKKRDWSKNKTNDKSKNDTR